MASLQLSDFSFDVPEHLVAQQPLPERDASRLLVRERSGNLIDSNIRSLPELLPTGTVIVRNNSRVLPARIIASGPAEETLEIFLLNRHHGENGGTTWRALGKPMRKLRKLTSLSLQDGLTASIDFTSTAEDQDERTFLIRFHCQPEELTTWLQRHGYIPLPPYIKRKDPVPAHQSADRERYQTIYSKTIGSVAAPTAGLHFTPALEAALLERKIQFVNVTLHVGGGTFLPVRSPDIERHVMHEEMFCVPSETLRTMDKARSSGRKIVCVGTTSLRCLESFATHPEARPDQWLPTSIFIRPRGRDDRYRVQTADALLTNFHQPESTLFMLISALIGLDEAQRMYAHAVTGGYRFFSYGDANLLWLDGV